MVYLFSLHIQSGWWVIPKPPLRSVVATTTNKCPSCSTETICSFQRIEVDVIKLSLGSVFISDLVLLPKSNIIDKAAVNISTIVRIIFILFL